MAIRFTLRRKEGLIPSELVFMIFILSWITNEHKHYSRVWRLKPSYSQKCWHVNFQTRQQSHIYLLCGRGCLSLVRFRCVFVSKKMPNNAVMLQSDCYCWSTQWVRSSTVSTKLTFICWQGSYKALKSLRFEKWFSRSWKS